MSLLMSLFTCRAAPGANLTVSGVDAPDCRARNVQRIRPVLFLHVMKTGGSTLCRARRHIRSGRQDCVLRYREDLSGNCRFSAESTRLFEQMVGSSPLSPMTTAAMTTRFAAAWPLLGHLFVYEPGWEHLHESDWDVANALGYAHAAAPLWSAYTFVICVRDPIQRFFSAVRMSWKWQRHKAMQPAAQRYHADGSVAELLRSATREPFRRRDRTWAYYELNNYLTQHLVPHFRQQPRSCTDAALGAALRTLNRFHVVLNLADAEHHHTSVLLAEAVLGISRDTLWHRPPRPTLLNGTTLAHMETMIAANACDLPIASAANKRIREDARRLGLGLDRRKS